MSNKHIHIYGMEKMLTAVNVTPHTGNSLKHNIVLFSLSLIPRALKVSATLEFVHSQASPQENNSCKLILV